MYASSILVCVLTTTLALSEYLCVSVNRSTTSGGVAEQDLYGETSSSRTPFHRITYYIMYPSDAKEIRNSRIAAASMFYCYYYRGCCCFLLDLFYYFFYTRVRALARGYWTGRPNHRAPTTMLWRGRRICTAICCRQSRVIVLWNSHNKHLILLQQNVSAKNRLSNTCYKIIYTISLHERYQWSVPNCN